MIRSPVDELNSLEVHVNKIEDAPMLMRAGMLIPALRQLLVVLRALVVSK